MRLPVYTYVIITRTWEYFHTLKSVKERGKQCYRIRNALDFFWIPVINTICFQLYFLLHHSTSKTYNSELRVEVVLILFFWLSPYIFNFHVQSSLFWTSLKMESFQDKDLISMFWRIIGRMEKLSEMKPFLAEEMRVPQSIQDEVSKLSSQLFNLPDLFNRVRMCEISNNFAYSH